MLWCQMRIADGHLNRLVPHQLLNCAKVYARHDQPACESVAEAMPGEVLQPRSLHGGTKPEPRRAQTGSVTGEEHIRAAVLVGLNRSQREDRSVVQWNVPSFTVLAAQHRQHPALEIDTVPGQPELLASAKTRIECKIKFCFTVEIILPDRGPQSQFLLCGEETNPTILFLALSD